MKPVVSLGRAWCCTVFSILCIVILGVFALLYSSKNLEMINHDQDTSDPKATAQALFVAIVVYVAFVVFCLSQILVHSRQPRSISLR